MKLEGAFPFVGEVIWLRPEQGGRASGPPRPAGESDYAATAFVPPMNVTSGLASFVLRAFTAGSWRSAAEGRWLVVENEGDYTVMAGTVVVVTEGPKAVAYFRVDQISGRGEPLTAR